MQKSDLLTADDLDSPSVSRLTEADRYYFLSVHCKIAGTEEYHWTGTLFLSVLVHIWCSIDIYLRITRKIKFICESGINTDGQGPYGIWTRIDLTYTAYNWSNSYDSRRIGFNTLPVFNLIFLLNRRNWRTPWSQRGSTSNACSQLICIEVINTTNPSQDLKVCQFAFNLTKESVLLYIAFSKN